MKDFPVNEQIRSHIVLLILANGEKKGQFAKAAAIQMARNEGMDLVQVAPGNPPVCKVADYGKMRYEASKAERKHHTAPCLKEMQFELLIAPHDWEVKTRKVEEHLAKGHKVQVSAILKGRQKYTTTHKDMARERIKGLVASLAGTATASPLKEGDARMVLTLSPVGSPEGHRARNS